MTTKLFENFKSSDAYKELLSPLTSFASAALEFYISKTTEVVVGGRDKEKEREEGGRRGRGSKREKERGREGKTSFHFPLLL